MGKCVQREVEYDVSLSMSFYLFHIIKKAVKISYQLLHTFFLLLILISGVSCVNGSYPPLTMAKLNSSIPEPISINIRLRTYLCLSVLSTPLQQDLC